MASQFYWYLKLTFWFMYSTFQTYHFSWKNPTLTLWWERMQPPQSSVVQGTPPQTERWAGGWRTAQSLSASLTKTSAYSQTPVSPSKTRTISVFPTYGSFTQCYVGVKSNWQVSRVYIRYARVDLNLQSSIYQCERVCLHQQCEVSQSFISSVCEWVCIDLPCPWSTSGRGSCGQCGCTLAAASTPPHPPVLALPHPPWWWSSHDGTTRR